MKTLLTLTALTCLSSALAAPLPLKEVVIQGGGIIQTMDRDGLLISQANTVPFAYTLTALGAPHSPIQGITLETGRAVFTDLERSQVERVPDAVAQQCLDVSHRDLQTFNLWLKDNNAVTGPGPKVIGPLTVDFSRLLDPDTFENVLVIRLTRTPREGTSSCSYEPSLVPRHS